jgi:type 1 glutamine amidotransferase
MHTVIRNVILATFVGMTFFFSSCNKERESILIFTKVNEVDGFRHESIEHGVDVLTFLANELGLEVVHTEDASIMAYETLTDFEAIVFLNTSRDILDLTQEINFQRFIRDGGGFLGIHGASTTEYDWSWYGDLVGAYFLDHPEIQEANLNIIDPNHQSCIDLPESWTRVGEWYNFRDIREGINVVIAIDESSYEGGKNGINHPIAWYHEFEGSRSFYTAIGHAIEAYDEPLFQAHLTGALKYVLGYDE